MLMILAFGLSRYKVHVDSFAHAREVFEEARDYGDYGSSDMGPGCGDLYQTDGGGRVGRVSYNGRVWDARGEEIQL